MQGWARLMACLGVCSPEWFEECDRAMLRAIARLLQERGAQPSRGSAGNSRGVSAGDAIEKRSREYDEDMAVSLAICQVLASIERRRVLRRNGCLLSVEHKGTYQFSHGEVARRKHLAFSWQIGPLSPAPHVGAPIVNLRRLRSMLSGQHVLTVKLPYQATNKH